MTYWKQQERRVKELLQARGWRARRQPGSGNLAEVSMKNDVWGVYQNGVSVSIDHKSTRGKDSISLNRGYLDKCFKDAEANEDFGFTTFGFHGKHQLYAVVKVEELLGLLEGLENEKRQHDLGD
jgi:Holliday junction resolvase